MHERNCTQIRYFCCCCWACLVHVSWCISVNFMCLHKSSSQWTWALVRAHSITIYDAWWIWSPTDFYPPSMHFSGRGDCTRHFTRWLTRRTRARETFTVNYMCAYGVTCAADAVQRLSELLANMHWPQVPYVWVYICVVESCFFLLPSPNSKYDCYQMGDSD